MASNADIATSQILKQSVPVSMLHNTFFNPYTRLVWPVEICMSSIPGPTLTLVHNL